MATRIMLRYMKSDYNSEDMGRGKSNTAKKRHYRQNKKRAKNRFLKDYKG